VLLNPSLLEADAMIARGYDGCIRHPDELGFVRIEIWPIGAQPHQCSKRYTSGDLELQTVGKTHTLEYG